MVEVPESLSYLMRFTGRQTIKCKVISVPAPGSFYFRTGEAAFRYDGTYTCAACRPNALTAARVRSDLGRQFVRHRVVGIVRGVPAVVLHRTRRVVRLRVGWLTLSRLSGQPLGHEGRVHSGRPRFIIQRGWRLGIIRLQYVFERYGKAINSAFVAGPRL